MNDMTKHKALFVVCVVSVVGVLFSGYLSYRELFTGTCNLGFVGCGLRTGPIWGLPACVYGLFMYTILLVTSMLGLREKK